MGSDLAQIYARVVAVRPDLAVEGLRHVSDSHCVGWFDTEYDISEPIASALITVKWLGALPRHANVQKGETAEGTIWEVWMPGQEEDAGWNTNLLHALAEFHAPGSTKGPNDER